MVGSLGGWCPQKASTGRVGTNKVWLRWGKAEGPGRVHQCSPVRTFPRPLFKTGHRGSPLIDDLCDVAPVTQKASGWFRC